MKHTRLYGKNTQNCVNYEAYTRVKYLERKQEEATFCSLIWWWCLPCCSVNCAYHRLQYKCHLKSFSSPFVFHSLSHLSDSKHTVKEINSCPYGFKTCCCNYAIEEFSWTFEEFSWTFWISVFVTTNDYINEKDERTFCDAYTQLTWGAIWNISVDFGTSILKIIII